jgi:gamma-glutamyl:cysteine ligase YbdK (ATP-grasp superfamily)
MKHGIEQELQVVNDTGRLVYKVGEILHRIPKEYHHFKTKGGIYQDVYDSQLEIATDASEDLEEIERELLELRGLVAEKAAQCDLSLIASGANHLANPNVGELFAEQHHLDAVTDTEKLKLNNFLRVFTPELFAISVNSPISLGRISRWKSYRASISSFDVGNMVNPNIKPTPYLKMEDIQRGYLKEFEHDEKKRKKSRYYDISPFTKEDRYSNLYKPTIEIRLFDAQPSIPQTMAYAALLRALIKKAEQMTQIPCIDITYNRNMAIERGIQANFILDDCRRYKNLHWGENESCRGHILVKKLLEWLSPEIQELGFTKYMQPLKNMVNQHTDLADWQINLYKHKQEEFIHTLIDRTMNTFDKEILKTKLLIEVVPLTDKKGEINPLIQKRISELLRQLNKTSSIDTRDLLSSLITIGELLPEKQNEMERFLKKSLTLLDENGSMNNSPLLTATFIEMMMIYGKTKDESYKRAVTWLLGITNSDQMWSNQIWLNAYILSILKKTGLENNRVIKQIQWIKEHAETEIQLWSIAYVVDSLTMYGEKNEPFFTIIQNTLKNNHWTTENIDDVSVTALIYKLLRNTGYTNKKIRDWLKQQLESINLSNEKSLHRLSLLLRSLSEDVLEKC